MLSRLFYTSDAREYARNALQSLLRCAHASYCSAQAVGFSVWLSSSAVPLDGALFRPTSGANPAPLMKGRRPCSGEDKARRLGSVQNDERTREWGRLFERSEKRNYQVKFDSNYRPRISTSSKKRFVKGDHAKCFLLRKDCRKWNSVKSIQFLVFSAQC